MSLLTTIVEQIVCWIMLAVISVFNLIIAAIGALLVGVMLLLPPMPSMPDMPEEFVTYAGWAGWFFPIDTVLEILLFVMSAQVIWWGVQLVMRWAKGVE